ncbi:MAG: dUTP diphosphatase [Bacteroidota bacterium]
MTERFQARILRINPEQQDIPLPTYATEESAGMDICAAVEKDVEIQPGDTVLISTGFIIELPQGHEAQVRPRSGLAIKHNIGILNSPGTVDSDYRGEVKIILTNFGKRPYIIHRGDRIAQMIVTKYERVQWKEVSSLAESVRGEGGFGHTGITSKGNQ